MPPSNSECGLIQSAQQLRHSMTGLLLIRRMQERVNFRHSPRSCRCPQPALPPATAQAGLARPAAVSLAGCQALRRPPTGACRMHFHNPLSSVQHQIMHAGCRTLYSGNFQCAACFATAMAVYKSQAPYKHVSP